MLSTLLALTLLAAGAAAPSASAAPARAGLHALLARTTFDAATGRYNYLDDRGQKLPLSFDPELQQPIKRLIDAYRVPLAQLVAVDPATGRVLAAIESRDPEAAPAGVNEPDLFPAASVFKIVTTSALLAQGVDPEEEVCFHGGKHRIRSRELGDDVRRDRRCETLTEAVAHSANVAIAKLADRNLDPACLRDWAARLLFNRPLPSDWPIEPSAAVIPDESFSFAQCAAGFGGVTLGAFHGAALASAIANGGLLAPLRVFAGDDPTEAHRAQAAVRLLPREMAADLSSMMELTVRKGTARRAFRFRGAKALDAAGKTGSIASKNPYHDYSWFVGFAPASAPRIAVAALVVNGPKWRIHASALAAAALRTYLHKPACAVRSASRSPRRAIKPPT
jgi:peptidoglycan glycosyltransferase